VALYIIEIMKRDSRRSVFGIHLIDERRQQRAQRQYRDLNSIVPTNVSASVWSQRVAVRPFVSLLDRTYSRNDDWALRWR